jgi:HAD superfamily hydrolase (TIGR01509 family)
VTPLRAVAFDMDGTLFDSEKLWTVSLSELAARLGGRISPATRAAMVGTNMAETIGLLHADVGAPAGAEVAAASTRWLLERTLELYREGMPWLPGARELVLAVRAAGLATALVTSTPRNLVAVALKAIGAGNIDVVVTGDEVGRNKPDPEPYRRAAALLRVPAAACLAIEDSPAGIASAEAAGCPVLAVPREMPVPPGPRRVLRATLAGVDVAQLRAVHAALTGTAADPGAAAGAADLAGDATGTAVG